jgi:hypothetical protein
MSLQKMIDDEVHFGGFWPVCNTGLATFRYGTTQGRSASQVHANGGKWGEMAQDGRDHFRRLRTVSLSKLHPERTAPQPPRPTRLLGNDELLHVDKDSNNGQSQ